MADDKAIHLTDDSLSDVSGGLVYKPKCPSCGKEVPGGSASAGKVIKRDGCTNAYFCKDCADRISETTFDDEYEYYKWTSGSATFAAWRKKQPSIETENNTFR